MISPPRRDQSLPSTIYTISCAETATVPTPIRGPLGLGSSPLGSCVIPPVDSTSAVTTRSISNETSVSVDKNWCHMQQLPVGSGSSPNQPNYASSLANTAVYVTPEKVPSHAGDSRRRLWSEVLADGPKYTSKRGNLSSEMIPFRSNTPSTALSQSSSNTTRTVIAPNSGTSFNYSGAVTTARSGKQESAGIISSQTYESAAIRTSSSQESASSSKRRRKFEQIPLRTEPPKSRKELRKERQARERAGQN